MLQGPRPFTLKRSKNHSPLLRVVRQRLPNDRAGGSAHGYAQLARQAQQQGVDQHGGLHVAFRIGSRLFSGCKNAVSGGLRRCKSLMSGKKVMKPSAVCVPLRPGDEQVSRACHGKGRKKRGGKTQGARAADHPARSAFAGSRPAMADRAKGEWPAAGGGRGAFGLALQEPDQLFAERKARIGPGCDLANALPGRKRTVSESGAVCALRPFTARLWTGAKRPAFAVPSGSRQQGGRGSETGANPGGLKRILRPFH